MKHKTSPITFRPSEYDAAVLARMKEENPQMGSQELIRLALRAWEVSDDWRVDTTKAILDLSFRLEALEKKLEAGAK